MPIEDESIGIADAQYYAQWYGRRDPLFYAGVLGEIVRRGRPGNLLDLGCGPGLILELALRWGLDAFGCDGSTAATLLAIGRVGSSRVIECRLSQRLPFTDDSFDNILLNQVIEHLPSQVLLTCIAETVRVLRPGGVVFIFSPSRGNRNEVESDPTHCNPLLPSELRRLLVDFNLVVMEEPNTLRTPRFSRPLAELERRLFNTARLVDLFAITANAYARKP